ncbi:MAG: penicillin-binding protein 2 [Chloroflexota bacterium]|nr:penicillin-binding protein 2 [Chloroflexota bacterium]
MSFPMTSGRSHQTRLWVFVVLVVALMGTLLTRLTMVQIGEHDDYVLAATRVNTRVIVQPAVRGRILDAARKPLADNTSAATVTVERAALLAADDGGRALIRRVAALLGMPFPELWGKTHLCGTPGAPRAPVCFNGSPYQPIPIAEGVDPRRALSLVEQPENFPGIAVEARPVRHYAHIDGLQASHILGYLDRATADDVSSAGGQIADTDLVGRSGLEAQYDAVLRGTSGRTTVSIDPRSVVTGQISAISPVPGQDVITHISAPIQAASEKALTDAVTDARSHGWKADSGAAVVLDVTNGAVVAAASYPSYRPEVWTGGISERDLAALTNAKAGTPLVSRATSSIFSPASTFKVISLPAAVNAGNSLSGTYNCGASFRVGNRDFHNYESTAHGVINLHKAIVISCDTIFYQFAYRSWLSQGGLAAKSDTADPFVAMAKDYGLGVRTGIDLPGESAGRIPDRAWKQQTWDDTKVDSCTRARTGYPEVARSDAPRAVYLKALAAENCQTGFQFRAGDAANFSIGQGDVGVTPLQMASAYAAIANGGTLWTPQLAAAFATPDGTTVRTVQPKVGGQVGLSPGMLTFLHSALRGVVTDGTAKAAFTGFPLASYPIAGKTGTAEVFGKQTTSWFVSYAPATRPKYAVVVVVSQAGTGAETAAPAVRKIYEAIRSQR